MIFKPQKITGRIPEGNYTGVIIEQSSSSDERYVWLKIEVEGIEAIFNVAIPVSSMTFNKFAQTFSNSNGEVNTEDFIDTMIEFSVTDREINGEIYSKIKTIEAVLED